MAEPAQQENSKPSEKSHVLVVDDDRRICALVCRFLIENDFIALSASDAAGARKLLDTFEFDAAVVDVMMPGETGLELTNFIQGRLGMPVLLLTALGETEDRIKGLKSGADDYLSKPFEPIELVLRLRAILRRTRSEKPGGSDFLKIGPWTVDERRNALVNGDEFIIVTQIEMNLINALSQYAGEPVSREKLAELCHLEGGDRTIDVQVTRLRKKIEPDTKNPRYLQTVRGKGYVLHVDRG